MISKFLKLTSSIYSQTFLLLVVFAFVVSSLDAKGLTLPAKQDEQTRSTQIVFDEMVKIFRENGADIEPYRELGEGKHMGLWLKTKDFKEIINSYDNYETSLEVARMVDIDEAPEYWENWSKVLAGGNFDYRKFFRDEEEMANLANYNVIVLMSHELGHYLDFRYMISDIRFNGGALRNMSPLNCSEGFADVFATAFVDHLATDPKFAELKARYIEMITEFNRSIPEKNRYNFSSAAFAEERCGEIDLMENGLNEDGHSVNENFFRQYASAYFNRHLIRLNADKKDDLKTTIQKRLIDPYQKRMQYSQTPISLRTVRALDNFNLANDIGPALEDFRSGIEFDLDMLNLYDNIQKISHPMTISESVLNEKGEPRSVEIKYKTEVMTDPEYIKKDSRTYLLDGRSFHISIADESGILILDQTISLPKKYTNIYNFASAVLPTDDEFLLVLNPFDGAESDAENIKKIAPVLIVQMIKKGGKWKTSIKELRLDGVDDTAEFAGSWFVTPQKKIRFLRRQVTDEYKFADLSLYEYDPRSAKARSIKSPFRSNITELEYGEPVPKGAKRRYDWETGAVGNDGDRLLIAGSEEVVQMVMPGNLYELNGDPRLLIGNFYGNDDGNSPMQMKITPISTYRFIDQDRLVFLSYFAGKTYLREVKFN